MLGVEVVSVITGLVTLARIAERRTELAQDEIFFADGWTMGLGLAFAGAYLLCGIAWMTWQAQAHSNLRALGRGKYRPAVVWTFLVPLVQLVVPFRAVADLARAGADRPGLRKWWWGLFIGANAVSAGAAALVRTEFLTAAVSLDLVASLMGVFAALLAMKVVRMINQSIGALRGEAQWPAGARELSPRARTSWGLAAIALTAIGSLGFASLLPTLVEGLEQSGSRSSTTPLLIGDCIDFDVYEPRSCRQPHDAEVYLVTDHPDQAAYPGIDLLSEWAEPICYARFEGYTGVPYQDSALDFDYLLPSNVTWSAGDREVICVVYNLSGDALTAPVGRPGL